MACKANLGGNRPRKGAAQLKDARPDVANQRALGNRPRKGAAQLKAAEVAAIIGDPDL